MLPEMLKVNDLFCNNNETELKEKNTSSSSFSAVIIFDSTKLLYEHTDNSLTLNGETPRLEDEDVSYVDKLIIEKKIQFERTKLDILVEELTAKLDIEKNYSMRVLGEVLQNIFIKYNDYCNMLIGICRILGRFELKEVMPWGPTTLIGLLLHKSETVKEYAVSVVENWADVELLPILRNLDCSSGWLKKYIDDVVQYLEECYVLHKKTV